LHREKKWGRDGKMAKAPGCVLAESNSSLKLEEETRKKGKKRSKFTGAPSQAPGKVA